MVKFGFSRSVFLVVRDHGQLPGLQGLASK